MTDARPILRRFLRIIWHEGSSSHEAIRDTVCSSKLSAALNASHLRHAKLLAVASLGDASYFLPIR
jgi:hypothetical protein